MVVSLPLLAIVVGVTLLAGVVQGSLGLGLALVASPGLSLVDPAFVPGPILAAALIASLWTWRRDRSNEMGPHFRWTLVGIPLGIPVGLLTLVVLPTPVLMCGLGVSVLVIAGLVSTPRLRVVTPTPAALGVGGFISALGGCTVGLTGPTIAIAYHGLAPDRLRFTMAVYLTIAQAVIMVGLIASGLMPRGAWLLTAVTVPGVLLGLMLSNAVVTRLPAVVMRRAILLVCCGAGMSLTLRAALGIWHG